MKIVIDARFWGPSHTGLGVYTRELVTNLAKIDSKNEYFILVRENLETISFPKNFHQISANYSTYSFIEQIILPLKLYSLHPDVVHFPGNYLLLFYFGKTIVTIHDLIKHQSRGADATTLP